MPIIDSSTLISIAKTHKPELLKLLNAKLVTIREVYEECVEKGLNLGYQDALKIKQLFDEKTITIEDLEDYEKLSGISKTDSKIISFAKAKEDYLFVDDIKLGRRAKAENIEVRNTPDVLLHLMKTKRLAKNEFGNLLQKLADNKRLSEKAKKLYEKAGGV